MGRVQLPVAAAFHLELTVECVKARDVLKDQSKVFGKRLVCEPALI